MSPSYGAEAWPWPLAGTAIDLASSDSRAGHDHHATQEDSPIAKTAASEGLERLLGIVRGMSPFLDTQGRPYCYATPERGEGRTVIDLDGEVTPALMTYLYHAEHHEVPNPNEVRLALTLVRGELWSKQPPWQPRDRMWAATVTAIVQSVRDHGDFVGSAKEALDKLQQTSRTNPQVFRDLPRNADQLGVVLVRIGLALRGQNIELFRPPRRDKARLWCWRELTPSRDTHDTPDTPTRRESGNPNGEDEGRNQRDDAPDTFTEEDKKLCQILNGARR